MNAAATHVLSTVPDLIIAYGVSDEFSFVFHRSTFLFERRNAKLVSTVVSAFTAAYMLGWASEFEGQDLNWGMLPTFDGRAVLYPTWENLRDYLSWRQVDCTFYTIILNLFPLPAGTEVIYLHAFRTNR